LQLRIHSGLSITVVLSRLFNSYHFEGQFSFFQEVSFSKVPKQKPGTYKILKLKNLKAKSCVLVLLLHFHFDLLLLLPLLLDLVNNE